MSEILTKKKLPYLCNCGSSKCWEQMACNTIQRAVELLRQQNDAYGKSPASEWYQEHYWLVEDIESFLTEYDGDGKEVGK